MSPVAPKISAVVAGIRSPIQRILPRRVYCRFEGLLGAVLVRGSSSEEEDVRTLLTEISQPEIRACAVTHVYEAEFGRLMGTVAHHGPTRTPPAGAKRFWPCATMEELEAAVELCTALQDLLVVLAVQQGREVLRGMLIASGKGWPVEDGYVPQPRGRGRPHDHVLDSVLARGAREAVFPGGAKPYKEVAAAIAAASGGRATRDAVYRRLWEAGKEHPVPKAWHGTLLESRIAPFRDSMFAAGDDQEDPLLVAGRKAGFWPKNPR